ISFSGFAQTSEIKKGDRFFAQRAYMDAADAYEKVSNKNQKVLQNLGDYYFYTNQMENAAEVYQVLFLRHEAEVTDQGYRFRLAHSIKDVNIKEEVDDQSSQVLGNDVDFQDLRNELDITV